MNLTVLGAGAWGTALAAAAAASAQHQVVLWARDARQAADLASRRCNTRYLPGVPLPPALRISTDWDAAVSHAQSGLTVIATPMAALRPTLQRLPGKQPALWLCKGFESGTGALAHEVAQALRPEVPCGVLSGPSFAAEVGRGQITALVAACTDPALADAAVDAFHGDVIRVYTSDDLVGVEVGGAVKNVLAIAVGILDGMAAAGGAGDPADEGRAPPGLNARAALITRGLVEMTRLGVALGGRAETFMGLSGLGDLVLTATGDLSRNRRVGLLLATGLSLPEVLAQLGHVAEGVYSAETVQARARQLAVDMPITQAVVAVLKGDLTPAQALKHLMAREARPEG